jgi:hypothetical protein
VTDEEESGETKQERELDEGRHEPRFLDYMVMKVSRYRRTEYWRTTGNVLDLVAWLEGCSMQQAALRLQEECYGAGMHVGEPQQASKGSSGSRGPERPPRLWFSLRLRWHPYLEECAVDPSTAAWFGVGYYAGCGFLRNRIVFPIHDQEGQLVAYAGRSLDGGEPRYLFPPGFHKSQVVFN